MLLVYSVFCLFVQFGSVYLVLCILEELPASQWAEISGQEPISALLFSDLSEVAFENRMHRAFTCTARSGRLVRAVCYGSSIIPPIWDRIG